MQDGQLPLSLWAVGLQPQSLIEVLFVSAILSLACSFCFFFSLCPPYSYSVSVFHTSRTCLLLLRRWIEWASSQYNVLREKTKRQYGKIRSHASSDGMLLPFLPLGSLLLQHRVRSPSPGWHSGTQGWHFGTFRS